MVYSILLTFSWPWSLATTLSVTHYWHAVSHKSRLTRRFFGFMRYLKPSAIILLITLFILLELSTSITRGMYVSVPPLFYVYMTLYSLVSCTCIILIIITSIRIFK